MSFEKIRDIIVETLDCDPDMVTPDASLSDDLGADSLDSVELNMALEDELGISIPDEQLMNIKKVSDIMSFVERQSA